MQFDGARVLVTGAGRGLGAEFTRQLVARGARVLAGTRTPVPLSAGAEALTLDVTDPASVAAAATRIREGGGLDVVVNNAGVSRFARLVDGDLDALRAEMETNYWGTLGVVRALAPLLPRGRAILNVLSVLSWLSYDGAGGYAASKAAAWSLTDGVRRELAPAGITVSGLVLASTDTDMMAGIDVPKNDPADVVRVALDGLAAGQAEILADATSVAVKAALSGPVPLEV